MKITQSRYIFSYITIIIIAALLAFFAIQHVSFSQSMQNELDETMLLYAESQLERIQTIDKMYYMMEHQMDDMMKPILEELQITYEKTGDIQFDLQAIKEKTGIEGLELYVITKEGIIVKSTKEEDLGISLKRLVVTLDEHKFYSPRLTYSSLDSILHKYTYYPTKDGEYVFEASLDFSMYNEIITKDSLESFEYTIAYALEEKNEIQSIHLFNAGNGRGNGSPIDIYKTSEKRIAGYEKATKTKEIALVREEGFRSSLQYIYVPIMQFRGKTERPIMIMELAYTNARVKKELNERFILQLFVLLVIAGFGIAMQNWVTRNYIHPVEGLIKGLKMAKRNELSYRLHVPKKETALNEAMEIFNEMVSNIEDLVQQKNENTKLLEDALQKNEQNYYETIGALVQAIDAKDGYTAGHCERTTRLSILIGEHLGLDKSEIEGLRRGSLLHDIGKIGIKDEILKKPGKLSEEEFGIIKEHPEIGYNIIKDITFMEKAKSVVLYHHERIDGKGYPRGLKGEEIPLLARILCITDSFDAMTSKRVYRDSKMTVERAFKELMKNTGTQFDANLVEVFIQAYTDFYGTDINRSADKIEKEK